MQVVDCVRHENMKGVQPAAFREGLMPENETQGPFCCFSYMYVRLLNNGVCVFTASLTMPGTWCLPALELRNLSLQNLPQQ